MNKEEAINYAKSLYEDVDVMVDKDGVYHVIRVFALEHWKQHYTTVAEVRVKIEVKMIDDQP